MHSDNTLVPTLINPIAPNVTLIPGAIANQKLPEPAYPFNSFVRQFRTVKMETYVRVSNSVSGKIQGNWLVKESSIRGMSAKEIQQNLALENEPNQIGAVEVPEGVLMRSGPVGNNAFGPGNTGITQYQLMEQIPSNSFQSPVPLTVPEINIPQEGIPIEPTEPIDPNIFDIL